MLDVAQLATAQRIIDAARPGLYTVRELYGLEWHSIRRPRAHGHWFRASVRGHHLEGVRWLDTKSNNSHLYEVMPRYAPN